MDAESSSTSFSSGFGNRSSASASSSEKADTDQMIAAREVTTLVRCLLVDLPPQPPSSSLGSSLSPSSSFSSTTPVIRSQVCTFSLWRADESRLALFQEGAALKIFSISVAASGPKFPSSISLLDSNSTSSILDSSSFAEQSSFSSTTWTSRLSLSAMKSSQFVPINLLSSAKSSSISFPHLPGASAIQSVSHPIARRPAPISALRCLSSNNEFDTVAVLFFISSARPVTLNSRRNQRSSAPSTSDERETTSPPQTSATASGSAYSLFCTVGGSEVLRIDVRQ